MKTNTYKILVLSDLKEKSVKALKYAAKLSKEIDAKVELLHVKGIEEITQMENSIAVMRKINEVNGKMNKALIDFVRPISKENDVKIKTTFALGNIKSVIENHIETTKPNMIILGDRETKKFNWFSDNIAKLVHKNYDGVVFEVTDANIYDKDGNISLDNLGLKNNIQKYTVKTKEKVLV
jgi:nucleotide-binding universal stress UspA family protein